MDLEIVFVEGLFVVLGEELVFDVPDKMWGENIGFLGGYLEGSVDGVV